MDRYVKFNLTHLLIVLVFFFTAPETTLVVSAQESPLSQSQPELNSNEKSETTVKKTQASNPDQSGKTITQPFLQIPTGEQYLINDKSKLDEMIKLLTRNDQSKIPVYSITLLKLTGKAVGDNLDLKVSITLMINETESPVEIPFYLNQGFLTNPPTYDGDGKLLQAGPFKKESQGYTWWVQGKGKHQLEFPLRLKLIRQLNNSRFQLSLPPSAITQLELEIPDKSIQIDKITNGYLEEIVENGKTNLKAFLKGTELDLRWHSVPKVLQEENFIQTKTDISLQVMEDTYFLNALQSIQVRNGSFQELKIELPEHFELVDVKSSFDLSHQVDSKRNVILNFSKPVTEKVEIRWSMEAARTTNDSGIEDLTDLENLESEILLNGFNLDNARKQSGTIEVHAPQGYQVYRNKDKSQNIHRMNPYKINFSPDVLTAYSFERQPFALHISTTELSPTYSVEPFLHLNFTENEIELDAIFQFEISANQTTLKKIPFHWPGFDKEKWIVEPIKIPEMVNTVQANDIQKDGSFIVRLKEVESNQTQILKIPVKARIPLINGEQKISLGLPSAEAPNQRDQIIILEQDPNLIVNSENNRLKSSGIMPNRESLPNKFEDLIQAKYYRVNPDDLTYNITLSKRPLQIKSTGSIIATQEENQFRINQIINFNVVNESIDRITLTVSAKEVVPESIQFLLNGNKVTANFSETKESNRKNFLLKLPEETTGQFQVQIDHTLPKNSIKNNLNYDIPVFHPQGHGSFLSGLTFEYRGSEYMNPIVTNTRWIKASESDDRFVWTTKQPAESIPLTLSNIPASFDYTVSKILIRNKIEDDQCYSRANYILSGKTDDLTITKPESVRISSIMWNQVKLDKSSFFPVKSDSGNLRIIPPKDLNETNLNNLLTISYTQNVLQNNKLGSLWTLETLNFPKKIWVEESIQEITLPFKDHLLTYPEGYDPLFSWTRNWFYWKREPVKGFVNLNIWFQHPLVTSASETGNIYTFRSSGAPQSLIFRSMTNSIIVLIGAGFALISSFFLIKFPVSRSVTSLFIFGLLFAFLRIWFENSITLFIQPAVLGMALAYLAVSIENKFKSEPAKTIVSLSSPSDLYLPAMPQSSIEQPYPLHAGSEDPTSVRPLSSNPLSKSEPGS